MNSDLVNIIETQDIGDAGVDDLLSPRPRALGDTNKGISSGATNYLGLNLGRSQSAAPETWEYGNPTSTKSALGLFGGRSRFFDEEEEDREELVNSIRRPASTGVIERPNNIGGNDDGDVNSILETLGLGPFESTTVAGQQRNSSTSDISSPYSTPSKPLGGIDSSGLVIGAHSPSAKSIMDKIHETPTNKRSTNYFTNGGVDQSPSNGGMLFSSNQASPQMAPQQQQQQYQMEQQQQQSLGHSNNHQGGQQQQQHIQYVQQSPQTSRQVHHQDQHSHYNPQQQVYYHHQPQTSAQAYHTQDYRGQQQVNYAIPQQQTVYHINAPAPSPYGYAEYHNPQQHIQHGVPANHIMMSQQQVPGAPQMHGQPQYISIVPVQAGPPQHIIGGAPGQQYAYVQYGDGGMVGAPPATTAFVMGPNGPIPISANPPMMAMNYSGHGSTPPGGTGRSPPRGSLRTPDRGQRKKNPMSTPRGKRADKNAPTPSKLGPEAANLLNEIRAAKSRNQWTIHDIQGHVVEFCLDQNGSRFIQQRLEVADPEEKNAVTDEIIPEIKDLNNDVFGNYVVQKLYEFGTDSMKKQLKGTLKGNMMLLSLQMYGCRVVQKALESLEYEDLCELLHEFDSYVLTCIQDQNGNHVMQKCIEIMSIKAKDAEARSGEVGLADSMAEKIQFIVDDVHANIKTLCCHPYGCRVLQRMLEHCVDHQKNSTLDQIQLVHKALLDDQYGNYVIQHVLQYGREADRDSLLNIIVENNLLKLSRQKFASNVVEKLLKYGNSSQRNAIVREMLKVVNEGGTTGQDGSGGSTVLLLMVRDAYANYVVQTAIDVVPEGNEKRMLLEELKANEVQLRNYTFAKHIVAKIGTK